MGHRRLLCWSLGIAVLLVASAAAAQTRAPPQKPEPSRPPLILEIPKPAGGARTPAPKAKQPRRQTPPAQPGATAPPPFVLPGPITLPQLPQLTPIPFPQIPPPAPQATPAPPPRLPPIVIRIPRSR